ncbi:MAG: 3-hydroxyacyl-[acyl-carrier-protein] dehydratase FabZ [Bacillota bacterium]|nr:MAG: 3-hydroxyacyl-[acyl-carrier-protein] dehydratase FabZ [Bacillota bacterium]
MVTSLTSGENHSRRPGEAGGGDGRPAEGPGTLAIEEILQILPHRYPFLLVDRILELEPGRRAVGIKCVSANEPFFQGHFPGRPIMPGVLILEAMAQVGAVAVLSVPENRGKLALFAGADRVRWRRPVVPGDRLQLEVEIIAVRGPVGKGSARATVEGELAAEAELSFALRPA